MSNLRKDSRKNKGNIIHHITTILDSIFYDIKESLSFKNNLEKSRLSWKPSELKTSIYKISNQKYKILLKRYRNKYAESMARRINKKSEWTDGPAKLWAESTASELFW